MTIYLLFLPSLSPHSPPLSPSTPPNLAQYPSPHQTLPNSPLTPPPGTGFATFTLPPPLRRLTLGICMDLNAQPPALWSVAEGPYEIAEHARKEGSGLLVLLNNWLDSGECVCARACWRGGNTDVSTSGLRVICGILCSAVEENGDCNAMERASF